MVLIRYPQEKNDKEIKDKIITLENTAWSMNEADETFPSAPNTYVTSFVLLQNNQAICHVCIRKNILFHMGEEYLAYGLSEVVTHPDYRRKGIASKMIQRAAEFIKDQKPDISIFTCEQNKVAFYTRGGWEQIPGACFVGGTKEKPFRSDHLNLG